MEAVKGQDIFLVITEDRHEDVDVEAFLTEEAAINYARWVIGRYARHPDSIEWDKRLNNAMKEDAWVWHTVYSVEGDSVRVIMRNLS